MRRIGRARLPAAAAISMLLAACAIAPGGSTGPIGHPGGNALILRVEVSGGFIAPAFRLTSFPSFTLEGDGRVIVPGAQDLIFPGPALAAANVRRLTEAGMQAVLREVASTGLFGASIEYRGAQNCVADAGDTIFIVHAAGRDVTVVVYGLGTLDPGSQCPGIAAAEKEAYRTLQNLGSRLGNLDAWLPATAWADSTWRPYEPAALRLLVRNADADQPDPSGIASQLLDWPDESDPVSFGAPVALGDQRCGVASGGSAQIWYAALSTANQLTRFVKDGHRYQVTVRFQLPDEPPTCPKLGA